MMNRFAKVSLTSMLALTLLSGSALAAAPIEVIVNGTAANTDHAAYLKDGTTMVPLNVVQKLPGVSISWNNSVKTVKITGNNEKTLLVVGQKTARQGTKTITLPVASTLEKGRVMVPLRFVAEVSGAFVGWNQSTHTVYVAKTSPEFLKRLGSSVLSEARSAALSLPAVSLLKDIQPTPSTLEGQSFNYYFPEGVADRFFVNAGDIIVYFEIMNGRSQEVWRARLDLGVKSGDSLFFTPYKVIEEDGVRPVINKRVVFYHVMTHIGAAGYGFVETNGTRTTLGTKDISMNSVFEIPEEGK
jgi:hypothetical protein